MGGGFIQSIEVRHFLVFVHYSELVRCVSCLLRVSIKVAFPNNLFVPPQSLPALLAEVFLLVSPGTTWP
jgi:hypothetical protein